ncbi:MAG: alpha-amylase family glycosyl hydrolase [Verrucomicrobiales bacterium]|nr:alpha-amylase family glycosyl hydrolase [Verrucomicrobiales bacterium]
MKSISQFSGSVSTDTSVHFRLWAPNADEVSVVGDFNDWDPAADPMKRGDDDHWDIDVKGADVGDEYKFVIKNGDQTLSKNDPRAREMTNSAGNSIVVKDDFDWGDDNFQMPPWTELVIYELHLGTFNRKGNGEVEGCFDDTIAKLDHLIDLGINAIELMPIAEFAGDQSWGYNPAFPFAVESSYGGVEGLKRFIKTCHSKGLAVIIDVVYNHFGPSDLDLWQFDGWSQDGMGGIYFYNDWRANTPWGDTRPDYGREEVRKYIFDNAMMWLDAFRADGLRFDMTFYMRSVDDGADIPEGWSLAQWINHEIGQRYPGKITIAEDLRSNAWITKDTGEGGAGFGSQWDEQFVHPVREVLTTQEDANRNLDDIVSAITFTYNGDPFQRVVYTESHDEVANGKSRVPTEVDEYDQEGYWARKRSALGACLTMTTPGIPMIFQGQELLATGHFEDNREMDWDGHGGVYRLYRDLIRLRTNSEGQSEALQTREISILHLNHKDKVLGYSRGEGDNLMYVIMNFSNTKLENYRIDFPREGRWHLLFHADAEVYGEGSDAVLQNIDTEPVRCQLSECSTIIELGGYDCAIFRYGN